MLAATTFNGICDLVIGGYVLNMHRLHYGDDLSNYTFCNQICCACLLFVPFG